MYVQDEKRTGTELPDIQDFYLVLVDVHVGSPGVLQQVFERAILLFVVEERHEEVSELCAYFDGVITRSLQG